MTSQLFKTVLVLTVLACALTQDPTWNTAGGARTFPNPDPSWNDFQIKSCCPKGFVEVYNYCVRCGEPNWFDPIDNKCKPCPADHTYSKVTGRCECFKCEAPRALNPVTNQCECKTIKGVQMIYQDSTNECVCPSNLPLWNGKYCVACPPATEYDPKEKQCYHCPEGFVRDYNSHACVPGL